jgi:hypothetical protein
MSRLKALGLRPGGSSGAVRVFDNLNVNKCARPTLLAVVVWLCAALPFCAAADADADNVPQVRVTFTDDDRQSQTVDGRIVVTAQDGGILLLGRDGRLWNITPDKLQKQEAAGKNFKPMSANELVPHLKQEFGEEFEVVTTRHYIICTNASPAYARWCGAMFERLMGAFRTHWRTRKLDLHDPKLPLVAIVFADAKQFAKFATKDAGPAIAGAKGYYSIRTNRMVLYDLTADGKSKPATTPAAVNRKLAASPFNVATVVHEATHQIAFNCGMHTRYADNPLWLSEGMAMYFETPDLSSRSGWRTVGKVNVARLTRFHDYVQKRRKANALVSLLSSNSRFAASETAEDAYAESWALTFFLIKTRRKEYVDYLNRLSKKTALIWDKPDSKLKTFRASFGDDLELLDRRFLQYTGRLGKR